MLKKKKKKEKGSYRKPNSGVPPPAATPSSSSSQKNVPITQQIIDDISTAAPILQVQHAMLQAQTRRAWKEQVDEASGRTYCYNEQTGETKWGTLDEAIKDGSNSIAAGELPPGWKKVLDANSREYFYNEQTGEIKWEKPQ